MPGLVKLWFRKVVKYYLAKTQSFFNHGPLNSHGHVPPRLSFWCRSKWFCCDWLQQNPALQKEMEQKPHRNTQGLDCRHHKAYKVDLTKLYTPKKNCSTTFPPFCWRVISPVLIPEMPGIHQGRHATGLLRDPGGSHHGVEEEKHRWKQPTQEEAHPKGDEIKPSPQVMKIFLWPLRSRVP